MDSDGPSTVSVTVDRAAWQAVVADPEQLCRQAVVATLRRAAPAAWLTAAEVSVLLCDDAQSRRLNASYRDQDHATNVLSFPALELDPDQMPAAPGTQPVLLGDIVLAAETVRTEALTQGKPPSDHFRHLIVHGCLHLLGHDHQDAADASRMERLERLILGELGIPDPYADAAPGGGDTASREVGA